MTTIMDPTDERVPVTRQLTRGPTPSPAEWRYWIFPSHAAVCC